MKKILLAIILCVSTMAFAQKDVFTINEYGTCEIIRQLDGTDASDLYKKCKAWLGQCNMVWTPLANGDVVNEKIDFTANFNTKAAYNPFAGMFTENLILDGHFVIDGNKATLTLNNIRIQSTYAGYGAKVEEVSVEDKIKEYEKYYDILTNGPDASLSKKEQKAQKKEAKDEVEDIEETLLKAGQELTERLDKLSAVFK